MLVGETFDQFYCSYAVLFKVIALWQVNGFWSGNATVGISIPEMTAVKKAQKGFFVDVVFAK